MGVVMCGGESRRMGQDKGLLESNNNPWAKIIANIFVDLGIEYVVSVNPSQMERYAQIFDQTKLIVDNALLVEGPLQGLLSVHEKRPSDDLLLIACDMKDMDFDTVKKLIDMYKLNKEVDYFAYKVADFIEPFCGIYSALGLKVTYRLAKEHSLQSYSLQKIIESGNSRFISIEDSSSFKNYNTL